MSDEVKVDLTDAVPNSHKYREETATIDENAAVISGTATIQKKSAVRKFLDLFIMEDAKSLKEYIFYDVFIPAIKETTLDVIEMLFYGYRRSSSSLPRRKPSNGGVGNVSYYKYSQPSYMDNRRSVDNTRRNGIDLGDILFETRADAEKALDELCEDIATYQSTTVSHLCRIAKLPRMWTDEQWGWYDLSTAEIRRRHTKDGLRYVLILPKPTVVD